MRRHLPPVALAFSLGEIIKRQLARGDTAAEHQRAVPVVRNDIIAFLHRDPERGQSLVAHARNVKMTFALAIQILFAKIAMPAFQEERKEAQLVFFAQFGHVRMAVG
jgi:hypothetical protein